MSGWVRVREFGTAFEAEMTKARLESADIPVMLTSHAGAIFGPGFQGAVPSGVEVRVPADRLQDARALLDSETDSS
jgi:hypothetical protein